MPNEDETTENREVTFFAGLIIAVPLLFSTVMRETLYHPLMLRRLRVDETAFALTPEQLAATVIPERLRRLGVHPHDVRGAIEGDLYTGERVPHVRWTKLRQPVAFRWPWHVQRAVWTLQRRWRRQKEDDDWCVLQQGFEPWTNSS